MEEMTPPSWISIGIDEAGYGPKIGPLVVAGVALAKENDQDPWDLLRPLVSRQGGKGTLLVDDSKRVLRSNSRWPPPFEPLERTVLAFAQLLHGPLRLASPLLALLTGEDMASHAQQAPWYNHLGTLPALADPQAIEDASQALGEAMDRKGLRLQALKARLVPALAFNLALEKRPNKLSLCTAETLSLLADLADQRQTPTHAICGRQSGRKRYASSLTASGLQVECVLQEENHLSSYRIKGENPLDLSFMVDGDSQIFEVALASMVAKYLRELVMLALNRYLTERIPNLKPTAGYGKDGDRFAQAVLSSPAPVAKVALLRSR